MKFETAIRLELGTKIFNSKYDDFAVIKCYDIGRHAYIVVGMYDDNERFLTVSEIMNGYKIAK